MTEAKQEHLYKILVIGELGTGKTSIIKRYVHQFFTPHYRATIGVDFALKVLNWDQNTLVRLQLWDIAGQERFGNMTRVYYKEAVGAFVVFDLTRLSTFEAVTKWKADLDSKVLLSNGKPIPAVLLANKCDLGSEEFDKGTAQQLDTYCKEKGFLGWHKTSAKENIGIDDSAKCLVSEILSNNELNEPQHHDDVVPLDDPLPKKQTKNCC
ncbi:Ras-related protein Rab-32-like [Oopsacas minuta]|uniref:Ras-related protein Rab n=1 Tax=Oopsacas minuta TaxID=111878 RepID=A0AAV7JB24_9METZ|nr:Ras-related protein Rab-32-like [Oopsacas minuta]